MSDHEQVDLKVQDGRIISVDKGLEDVIKRLWDWDFTTTNSCVDNNGSVWIEFGHFGDFNLFMQLALKNRNSINVDSYVRETLWDFLEERTDLSLAFAEECIFDPDVDNTVIGTGVVEHSVGMRFEKGRLVEFRKLFNEVFGQ